ncbi:hypothetical protein [Rufibacter sp. XAAS-G3-1]|uniref:hypothetical protein n=1 Tax=Rufibacter sp. XAAS-G3-1 TaxID=2729134 RepID=UPI0015E7713B|nr:hypothetical protein [Rufibacter sp. XAAS-G3-1]
MVVIAQTPFYLLRVDRERNRILLNLSGSWNSPEEVPFYLLHLKEALAFVKPGFSVLTDSRVLEDYAPAVRQLHIDAQKMTVEAGISQVAEVHELKNSVNQVIIAIAEESRIPLNIFDSLEDADAWLTEIQPK